MRKSITTLLAVVALSCLDTFYSDSPQALGQQAPLITPPVADVSEPLENSTIQVYSLAHASAVPLSDRLISALHGKDHRIIPDRHSNTLLVVASDGTHRMIADLVKILDQPAKLPTARIKIVPLMVSVHTVNEVIRQVVPGVSMSVDDERQLLILSAESDEEITAAQSVMQQLEAFNDEHSANRDSEAVEAFSLRIVFLETNREDPNSVLKTNDLSDALAPLADVGVAGLRVAAQSILRVGSQQTKIESDFEGDNGQRFRIRGTPHPDSLELQLTDDETEMSARVSLQPGQWVILGAVGSADRQKVFAVQRMGN